MTKNGEQKHIWRCVNVMENGRDYCELSQSVDEEELHLAICRGLQKSIEEKKEIKEAIVSACVYSFTKQDEVLDTYAIQQQIHDYNRLLDETIILAQRTMGDTTKYEIEIKKLSDQIAILNQRIKDNKNVIETSESTKLEIEKISRLLENKDCFSTYREWIVRRVVDCIRVMGDGTIEIIMKGGHRIKEEIKNPIRRKNIKVV